MLRRVLAHPNDPQVRASLGQVMERTRPELVALDLGRDLAVSPIDELGLRSDRDRNQKFRKGFQALAHAVASAAFAAAGELNAAVLAAPLAFGFTEKRQLAGTPGDPAAWIDSNRAAWQLHGLLGLDGEIAFNDGVARAAANLVKVLKTDCFFSLNDLAELCKGLREFDESGAVPLSEYVRAVSEILAALSAARPREFVTEQGPGRVHPWPEDLHKAAPVLCGGQATRAVTTLAGLLAYVTGGLALPSREDLDAAHAAAWADCNRDPILALERILVWQLLREEVQRPHAIATLEAWLENRLRDPHECFAREYGIVAGRNLKADEAIETDLLRSVFEIRRRLMRQSVESDDLGKFRIVKSREVVLYHTYRGTEGRERKMEILELDGPYRGDPRLQSLRETATALRESIWRTFKATFRQLAECWLGEWNRNERLGAFIERRVAWNAYPNLGGARDGLFLAVVFPGEFVVRPALRCGCGAWVDRVDTTECPGCGEPVCAGSTIWRVFPARRAHAWTLAVRCKGDACRNAVKALRKVRKARQRDAQVAPLKEPAGALFPLVVRRDGCPRCGSAAHLADGRGETQYCVGLPPGGDASGETAPGDRDPSEIAHRRQLLERLEHLDARGAGRATLRDVAAAIDPRGANEIEHELRDAIGGLRREGDDKRTEVETVIETLRELDSRHVEDDEDEAHA